MDSQVGQSLDGSSLCLSSKLCLCNSFHGYFVPDSKKGQSVHTLVFVLQGFSPLSPCSLPFPNLNGSTVYTWMEFAAQSFCHAHCWSLPLSCSEAITWSPCYWIPRLFGGNRAPFPCFITACGTVKLSFDQNACLSCIIFSRRLALLLFQVSKMPFQARTQAVICWPDTTTHL